MLFPCPGGSVFGEALRSEVEVHLKAKFRWEMSSEIAQYHLFRLMLQITPTQVKKRALLFSQVLEPYFQQRNLTEAVFL